MIQAMVKKLNGKRLRQRISSAILIVAILVSFSGILGGTAMLVMGVQYNHALTNYGFSQGDIGKMMITFADTRSNLRAAIGYQDKTLVQETYEAYETKKQACKDYAVIVEETVASAEERKLYDQIMSGMEDYFTSADKVIQMGKDVTNIDQRNQAQRLAKDEVVPKYEAIYENMVQLLDANTSEGNKLEINLKVLTYVLLAVVVLIIIVAILIARKLGDALALNIVNPLDALAERFKTFAQGDLTSEFPVMESEDEVSDMVTVAKDMAENLSAVIKDVNYRMELMAKNEVHGLMFKMENDPRITKVGAFIRKTSIDELPQFWNVLKGDMSLVGTRPPTVDEYEQYTGYQKRRISFRPGITGLWQISGRSDIKDFDEVVKLDLEYIDNWSLLLDLKIICKTILVVFKGSGAK